MPAGGEWFCVWPGEGGTFLGTVVTFLGFNVLSLPVAMARVVVALVGRTLTSRRLDGGRGVGRACGGNAPRDCPSNVHSGPVWLGLGVRPRD